MAHIFFIFLTIRVISGLSTQQKIIQELRQAQRNVSSIFTLNTVVLLYNTLSIKRSHELKTLLYRTNSHMELLMCSPCSDLILAQTDKKSNYLSPNNFTSFVYLRQILLQSNYQRHLQEERGWLTFLKIAVVLGRFMPEAEWKAAIYRFYDSSSLSGRGKLQNRTLYK